MALSCAVRRQLLAASLPEATQVRLELQDYLARTGMAPPDFARRINYARETVYSFLNGNYSWISSNDGPIRAAIRGFIAAHPIATPVVSSGKLYETENARLLRQYFYEALDHGRAYYLYGAPGTQKTSYGQKTHRRCRGRGVYPTEGSCRFPLIVLQQTTQSFLATHNSAIPACPSIRQGEQQPVLLALVIALLVVMGHILLQGSAQRSLPEQDQLRQAFLFHRSHPAFCIGVQIRAPGW